MLIRDFVPEDLPRLKEIHEQMDIDYQFPDLLSPLFLVKKVLVDDGGVVRAGIGGYLQLEAYLFLDTSEWATPGDKYDAIRCLESLGMRDAFVAGIDCCCLYLPPGYERFGERLVDMGFTRDRDGWHSYSKRTG